MAGATTTLSAQAIPARWGDCDFDYEGEDSLTTNFHHALSHHHQVCTSSSPKLLRGKAPDPAPRPRDIRVWLAAAAARLPVEVLHGAAVTQIKVQLRAGVATSGVHVSSGWVNRHATAKPSANAQRLVFGLRDQQLASLHPALDQRLQLSEIDEDTRSTTQPKAGVENCHRWSTLSEDEEKVDFDWAKCWNEVQHTQEANEQAEDRFNQQQVRLSILVCI